jgi:3',5'-cyclic AMP phosphodiesterase CpdA
MLIAHISDLHLNYNGKHTNFEKVEALIVEILTHSPKHIIISGDISEDGRDEDFRFLRELLIKYQLLNSERTTIVIGNHDIFGTAVSIEDALYYPDRCKNINYKDQIKRFHSFFPELMNGCLTISEDQIYPFIKPVEDIFLLGLNSIDEYSTRNFAASKGYIDKQQRKDIATLLKNFYNADKPLALAIHHHFYKISREKNTFAGRMLTKVENITIKLRRRKKLLRFMNQLGVSTVFHGHYHDQKIYRLKRILFSNSGGSVKNGLGPLAQYNLIKLNRSENSISSYLFDTASLNLHNEFGHIQKNIHLQHNH